MSLVIPRLSGEHITIDRADTYFSDYRTAGPQGSDIYGTIVGLNGLAGSCDSFWPLLEEMPPNWRWLLPDLPGGGKSGRLPIRHDLPGYVAWLDAFLDRFCPDQPVVLQSVATGAAIAIEYASLFPQRVRGLILHLPVFDGAAFSPQVRWLVGRIATSNLGQRVLDSLRRNDAFMHRLIPGDPPTAIPEMAQRDIEHKQQADLQAVGEFLEAVMQNKAMPKLERLTAPLFILGTAHDFSAPLPLMQQITHQRSNRQLYIYEGGHSWNEEFIAIMVRECRQFLESLH